MVTRCWVSDLSWARMGTVRGLLGDTWLKDRGFIALFVRQFLEVEGRVIATLQFIQ